MFGVAETRTDERKKHAFPVHLKEGYESDSHAAAYVMWEPDESPPFGPNAYDDPCNSPDPNDNGGVGRRHSGAVTMCFGGSVEVVSFRKWQDEQYRKPGLLWCNPFAKDGY
jgi:hypothetical protein